MASVYVPDLKQKIDEPQEIADFLAPFGIIYEKWDVGGRIGPEASNEEILEAYAPEIERLKETGGFVTADVINVNPDTPGLDEMLAKFDKEHFNSKGKFQ